MQLSINDQSDRKYDVIFLAPAVTFTLFAEVIIQRSAKISNLRMFAMADKNERKDDLVNAVPWLYPSSLLYLVSGVCERDANGNSVVDQALVGMHRFYSVDYKVPTVRASEINTVRQYFAQAPNSIFWSVTTSQTAGQLTESVDHGFFDNDPKTIESIRHLIEHGY